MYIWDQSEGFCFQDVRLHLVRLFWNQILTWLSVRLSLSAKRDLSAVVRYCVALNAFSSSSICIPENVARPFLSFLVSLDPDELFSVSPDGLVRGEVGRWPGGIQIRPGGCVSTIELGSYPTVERKQKRRISMCQEAAGALGEQKHKTTTNTQKKRENSGLFGEYTLFLWDLDTRGDKQHFNFFQHNINCSLCS